MQTYGVGQAASDALTADLTRLLDRARPNGAVTVVWQGGMPPALIDNLKRIGGLAPGWDSYGAPAIAPLVQRQALDIAFRVYQIANTLGMKLPEVDAFASSDGRVGLLWRDQSRNSDLEVLVGDASVEAFGSRENEV